MFEQEDREIQAEYEAVRKEWEVKRQQNERYRKMKETMNDFDYFVDNAQWWSTFTLFTSSFIQSTLL